MTNRGSRWTTIAGWVTLGIVLLLALGGAAAAPEGRWLGLPPRLLVLAVLLGGAVAGRWARLDAKPLAGLGLIPLALLMGLPIPGLGALCGPPLMALALGGVAMLLAARGQGLPRAAYLPLVGALYALAAVRVQSQVGPAGDEPHYLMVADSLWMDGDVALSQDYAEGRYRAFHQGPLVPHYRVRGKGGEIYSVHSVGLSLLILPAYALGGYPAVSFFMALLAALLAREVRELVRDWTGQDRLAEGLGWLIALSPPLIHYAGLVFTEVPAALAVVLVLRHAQRPGSARSTAAWASALAFLPWLHARYATLAIVLVLYALAGRPRRSAVLTLVGICGAAAIGLGAYHWALYGSTDPRVVWGRRPELSWSTLPQGLPGLLLDQEFGLLIYAPVLALAVPGLVALWRASRREGAAALGLVLTVLVTAGAWHMWRGGWNPPGRFLVPALPVLALATAMTLRRGLGAAAALLVGWSLWTGLGGAWQPRLVHRDRDGTAPFFRELSGAEEWTRLLPGFVLEESATDRGRLAVVWALGLGVAVVVSLRVRSSPGPGRVAAASLAWLACASAASKLSRSRTVGRDAVRLVGRPALMAPGFALTWAADARWGPEALGWGPLYEPHRHPSGAELGSRLPLRPGTYEIRLSFDGLGGAGARWLELLNEAGGARAVGLVATSGEAVGRFEVGSEERAISLRARGGEAFLLKQIRVSAQP